METSLPTPMTARVYVNLPEGTKKKGKTWFVEILPWFPNLATYIYLLYVSDSSDLMVSFDAKNDQVPISACWSSLIIQEMLDFRNPCGAADWLQGGCSHTQQRDDLNRAGECPILHCTFINDLAGGRLGESMHIGVDGNGWKPLINCVVI